MESRREADAREEERRTREIREKHPQLYALVTKRHEMILRAARAGLTGAAPENPEQVMREYLDKRLGLERLLRDVYEACGHRGNPTAKDLEMYKKWQHEWGFNHELICCAAEQASGAEGNKITYLDKVLEAWHEAGITEISQIRDKRGTGRKQYGKTVSAQQYTQRVYTEAELLAVSDDLFEEARKYRITSPENQTPV